MTSQMASLANLVGLVSFSAFWGCGVSTFQKLKMLGSVMIRKCVEMELKNRCLHLITKNILHFFSRGDLQMTKILVSKMTESLYE